MPSFESTFLTLIADNHQKLLRACRVYAWTAQDREDLYQEVLLQIWRALPSLKEQIHANTWLYRIALNTAISFVRKSTAVGRRSIPVEHSQIEEVMALRQKTASPQNSRIDALYKAIKQLDKIERAVIMLFLEEMSYEQIGEILGMSAGHIGVMLHRTKKKLFLLMNGGEWP